MNKHVKLTTVDNIVITSMCFVFFGNNEDTRGHNIDNIS